MHLTFYVADSSKWFRNKKYNQKGLPLMSAPTSPVSILPKLGNHNNLPEIVLDAGLNKCDYTSSFSSFRHDVCSILLFPLKTY